MVFKIGSFAEDVPEVSLAVLCQSSEVPAQEEVGRGAESGTEGGWPMSIRLIYHEGGAIPVAFCDHCEKPVSRDDGLCVFFEGKVGDASLFYIAHKGKCTGGLTKRVNVESFNAIHINEFLVGLNQTLDPDFTRTVKVTESDIVGKDT